MIYISSACSTHKYISQAVRELAEAGFRYIELTGGTKYYEDYEEDLINLKQRYQLNYLVHNYFPPPQKNFVLNLASLDEDIYQVSLRHCKKAIELSHKLGGQKIGFHAGFLLNIKPQEIGKTISKSDLFTKEQAVDRFCAAILELQTSARQHNIDLYIENNVFSSSNRQNFLYENPFMLTNYDGYLEIMEKIKFNLLLDLAHLKVSCHSLKLSFEQELELLIDRSDYIHISDNDGLHDQNQAVRQDSQIFQLLAAHNLSNKTITLEIYRQIDDVYKSYYLIKKLVENNGASL